MLKTEHFSMQNDFFFNEFIFLVERKWILRYLQNVK